MTDVVLKNVLSKTGTVLGLLELLTEHDMPLTEARIDYQDCGSHQMVVWTGEGQWWEVEQKSDDVKVVDCG